ncbi:MAG: glutamate--tRNA ligase [Traorella sp.]
MKRVRVRYAPSPTGFLHIGNARTAMFNYLFAKHYDGDFVLRIEDTDVERNVEGGEESQMHYLHWLGMDPDEGPTNPGKYGPYRQMERLDIYKKIVDELLERGLAYKCFCTAEELAEVKAMQEAAGIAPMYNRKCLHMSEEERKAKEEAGLPYVIRLKVPANKTYTWNDMIRGKISVDSKDIGDWVIVKSNGIPTYNFAVVVDDHFMEISHVFRGEEHISNTPKQLMVYEMMGWEAPQFGHMTLIVNEQHKKLSKRDHSIMQYVSQYDEAGYLPQAMFNFMALLGWSPANEEEIFTKEELIKEFSEERLSKSPSMFDKNKLAWVNNRYIKALSEEEFENLCLPYLVKEYGNQFPEEYYKKVISLYHDQLSYGQEILEVSKIFFKDIELDNEAKEVMTWETQKTILPVLKAKIEAMDETAFTPDNVKAAIKEVQKETGIKGKPLFMGIRVALTHVCHGPELKDVITTLGKERVLERL